MTNKRALITGCSTGIGRATAVELTDRGYDVIATCSPARDARRPEGHGDARARRGSTTRPIANVLKTVGAVDVLVNNVGFGVEGAVESVPLDEVQRMFNTNVMGSARMIQAFLPAMRERGSGAIVNVTSTAGIVAPPLGGYYAATKFALEAISEALSIEVGHFGVKVIVIEPGFIETQFGANVLDHRGEPGPYEELGEDLAGRAGGAQRRASGARARAGRRRSSPTRSSPTACSCATRSAPTPRWSPRHARA